MEKIYKLLNENRPEISNIAIDYMDVVESLIVEEPAELIQAIMKVDRRANENLNKKLNARRDKTKEQEYLKSRNRLKQAKDNLYEEIADVLIAIEMFMKSRDLDEQEVREWIKFKMNRMKDRADKGEFY